MGDLLDPEEDPADELPDIDRSAALCSLLGIACGLHINRLRECT